MNRWHRATNPTPHPALLGVSACLGSSQGTPREAFPSAPLLLALTARILTCSFSPRPFSWTPQGRPSFGRLFPWTCIRSLFTERICTCCSRSRVYSVKGSEPYSLCFVGLYSLVETDQKQVNKIGAVFWVFLRALRGTSEVKPELAQAASPRKGLDELFQAEALRWL